MRIAIRWTLAAALLMPASAGAEPITLKLAFYSSDRSLAYQAAVKPFVDAINSEGKDLLHIELFMSGSLGKVQKEQPQLVRSGDADIAFIVPGRNPELFPDDTVIELPGLFRNTREATTVYTSLIAADALAGYADFFVIGAYATDPQTIHSRKTLASLADLKGQKVRANNNSESAGLAKLGALPSVLAFNETTPAIASRQLDGAMVNIAQLFDVGIGRFTSHHYLLPISTTPLTLMMNRKVFERLPENAKALIRKHSAEWTASHYIAVLQRVDKEVLEQIMADPRRTVVSPSPADLKTAQDAFVSIRNGWAAESPHNRALLDFVERELAKLRSTN